MVGLGKTSCPYFCEGVGDLESLWARPLSVW